MDTIKTHPDLIPVAPSYGNNDNRNDANDLQKVASLPSDGGGQGLSLNWGATNIGEGAKLGDLCQKDKAKVAKLIQEVSAANAKLQSQEQRLERLRLQNGEIVSELADSKSKFNEAMGLLKKYQRRSAALQEEGEAVALEREKLKQRCVALAAETQQVTEERDELRARLENHGERYQNLAQSASLIPTLEETNKAQTEKVLALESSLAVAALQASKERAASNALLHAARLEQTQLKDEIRQLQEERIRLREELDSIRKQTSTAGHEEIETIRSRLEEQSNIVETLRKENAALLQTLEEERAAAKEKEKLASQSTSDSIKLLQEMVSSLQGEVRAIGGKQHDRISRNSIEGETYSRNNRQSHNAVERQNNMANFHTSSVPFVSMNSVSSMHSSTGNDQGTEDDSAYSLLHASTQKEHGMWEESQPYSSVFQSHQYPNYLTPSATPQKMLHTVDAYRDKHSQEQQTVNSGWSESSVGNGSLPSPRRQQKVEQDSFNLDLSLLDIVNEMEATENKMPIVNGYRSVSREKAQLFVAAGESPGGNVHKHTFLEALLS